MTPSCAWWNGTWSDVGEVRVSLLSPTVGRGLGIFEVIEVVSAPDRPAVFRLDAHLARLAHSADSLDMRLPYPADSLAHAALETVRRNGVRRGVVKILACWAEPEWGLMPRRSRVDVAIFAADFVAAYGKTREQLLAPARVGVVSVRKLDPETVDVTAKVTGHYVNAWRARREALARGFDEALLLDRRGFVAEAPVSNVFFVRGERIVTPRVTPALAGITRDSVLAVIRSMNVPCEEADVSPDEARSADEAFLTGTSIGVRPVLSVDGQRLGAACPGPLTARVDAAFAAACEGRDPRFRHWLTWAE